MGLVGRSLAKIQKILWKIAKVPFTTLRTPEYFPGRWLRIPPAYNSSPDEDVAKSRNGLRRSHPFQEENMHMTKGWSGLRTAVIALSLFAWTTTGVKAAPVPNLLDYSTAGLILGPTGISGTNVISFVPVGQQQPLCRVDPNSNLPLGSFQVAPLPAVSARLTRTRRSRSASSPLPMVDTTLTGVTPVDVDRHSERTGHGRLPVERESLVQSGRQRGIPASAVCPARQCPAERSEASGSRVGWWHDHAGRNHREQQRDPNPPPAAPEPSTIALFLSTIGGLGLRRYVLSRRRHNKA